MLTKITENCILHPKIATMFKVKYIFAFLFLTTLSCGPDDEDDSLVAILDRGEEALVAQAEIEEFLATHFYNYEDFTNPTADFDFKIIIGAIAGENADKTPLTEHVSSKIVKDRFDEDVEYKLYYLSAVEGAGDTPDFPDIAILNYEGLDLDLETFDGSNVPVAFDLTAVVNGFQDVMTEFKAADGLVENPDGTISFENFGVGAMFLPSGLAYFNNPPFSSSIDTYDQLIFTFQLFETIQGDQDNDGVPSIYEDDNDNGFEEDDDTDGDLTPNYLDSDDDNDGIPTSQEILDEDGVTITDPELYPDVDNDGTPDYLDADS